MKRYIFFAALALWTMVGLADEIVVQGPQTTDKVVLVVDLSSSMLSPSYSYRDVPNLIVPKANAPEREAPLTKCLRWVFRIILGLGDQGRLQVWGFADKPKRWAAPEDWCQGEWILLPNQSALESSIGFLESVEVGGSTDITQALLAALSNSDEPNVSIILLSDLEDTNFSEAAIKEAMAKRKFVCSISVVGIIDDADSNKRAIAIAQEHGGTYVRIKGD